LTELNVITLRVVGVTASIKVAVKAIIRSLRDLNLSLCVILDNALGGLVKFEFPPAGIRICADQSGTQDAIVGKLRGNWQRQSKSMTSCLRSTLANSSYIGLFEFV
jgi:hypothetical protein